MKKKKLKKILIGIAVALVSVIVIFAIAVFAIWHNEIASIASIRMLVEAKEENKSAPVYIMDVKGNYYFDDFIEQGGVSSDAELIDFIVGNITKGLVPMNIKSKNIGCSSFTAQDEQGNRYFGRNYDFSTTTGIIVRTNPTDGRYASISSADLQFIGITDGAELDSISKKILCLAAPFIPLDGINEKGVACGIYMTYQGPEGNVAATNQQTDKPDITSTTMLRMILDYAASVDEAVALVEKYDLHDSADTSFHYMVADSTGKSAVLEWVAADDENDTDGTKRELKVYYNDDDAVVGTMEAADNFQYLTNFIITPDYYASDADKKGLDRYEAIENAINPDGVNTDGIVSEQACMDVLKLVGRRRWDTAHGKTDSNSITVWSALYNLTDKSATWVSNEEFDNPDAAFTFAFSGKKH